MKEDKIQKKMKNIFDQIANYSPLSKTQQHRNIKKSKKLKLQDGNHKQKKHDKKISNSYYRTTIASHTGDLIEDIIPSTVSQKNKMSSRQIKESLIFLTFFVVYAILG